MKYKISYYSPYKSNNKIQISKDIKNIYVDRRYYKKKYLKYQLRRFDLIPIEKCNLTIIKKIHMMQINKINVAHSFRVNPFMMENI